MATEAHCAYCFEVLAASLGKRKPAFTLAQTEDLWREYTIEQSGEGGAQDDEMEDEASLSSEAEDEDEEMTNQPPPTNDTPVSPVRSTLLSRLIAPSGTSLSSSSTPSTRSTASLRTEDSSSTSQANSKSSSRTSLFPFTRRSAAASSSSSPMSPGKEESHPLFVTWNTITARDGRSLRGCIGTFEPQPLEAGLRSYALTSAFEDTRFSPIPTRELPRLECGVTLLTNFEPISDPLGWSVGTHGLRISFSWHGRRYGATYLPDVPREQGWTREETVVSLMRKAGWVGRKDEWRSVGDLNVVRYQGAKVAMTHAEFEAWRAWVMAREGKKGKAKA